MDIMSIVVVGLIVYFMVGITKLAYRIYLHKVKSNKLEKELSQESLMYFERMFRQKVIDTLEEKVANKGIEPSHFQTYLKLIALRAKHS